MSRVDDWLSRVTIPDLYPRKEDPFRPGPGIMPMDAPAASMLSAEEMIEINVWQDWLTQPGARPVVYQRALNFQLSVTATPQPLSNGQFQCDTIILDVASTAANSVFYGYGSGVTTTSGIEVRAGLPHSLQPDNQREMWEIQRLLEAIAAMIAAERGYPALGAFRAPRVVFNSNDYYIVGPAGTTTTVAVMMFLIPEMQ